MPKRKVLLIDDDPDMVAIGRQIFSGNRFEFLCANEAESALAMLLEHRPDLVLLDFLLPDINGLELIDRVATDADFEFVRETPFVILTAWEEDYERIRPYYSRGLRAFLTKPFGHRELRCLVDNVIEAGMAKQPGRVSPDEEATDEFRDLLFSIKGQSEHLIHWLDGTLSEQQEMDLVAIHNASARLLDKLDSYRLTEAGDGKAMK